MDDLILPEQIEAVEKLAKLRVGALYGQQWGVRTAVELVTRRLQRGKIDGALWICEGIKYRHVEAEIARHLGAQAEHIRVQRIESLSHNCDLFMELMRLASAQRLMLVIGDGLLIKNVHTVRAQRVIALGERCPYRLLLSDVPFSCGTVDLFAQWYALDWRILGYRTLWGFRINHANPIQGETLRNEAYLARAIAPYCAQVAESTAQSGRREFVWRFSLAPEVMDEYRRTLDRFLFAASNSSSGVYRLLHACQHVACGMRVVRDFPMATEPIYTQDSENPRLRALMQVLPHFEGKRVLILCRYTHECRTVHAALAERYGAEAVEDYTPLGAQRHGSARFTVMNVFVGERDTDHLAAEVVLHYSHEWDWRKRSEKESRCAATGNGLTVVSLVAADTIDMRILRCVWKKEKLIASMFKELKNRGSG